jgi:hypothetical protein
MGLLQKALKERRPSSPIKVDGGLFNRATRLRISSNEGDSVVSGPAPSVAAVFPFASLESGVACPASFFAIARSFFGTAKGALFLKDDSTALFSPWAQHGFDETTSRRLRFPLQVIDEVLSGHADFTIVSGPTLQGFRLFFSRGEFQSILSLAFFPIRFGESLLGFLMFSVPVDAEREEKKYRSLSQTFLDAYPALVAYRSSPFFTQTDSSAPAPHALADEIARIAKSMNDNGRSGLLIAISLERMTGSISVRFPVAERYRLSRDGFRIVSLMISPLGRTFPIGDKVVLFCLEKDGSFDTQLFLMQLQKSIKRFLPSWCDASLPLLFSRPLTAEKSEIAALIASLPA